MKKAVMYGAGNIGRGFIGQLFFKSGYETVFLDISEPVINKLNEDKSYPLYIAENEVYTKTLIENVRGVNSRDEEAASDEIASADVCATAVGVKILPFIAPVLAKAVAKRMKAMPETYLNVIICENMIDADKYLASLVKEKLSDEEKAWFDEYVGFSEASVGRMVPAAPKEITEQDPLAVCVEAFCELPVDKDAMKGEIPYVANMKPFAPFSFYIERKLFMHNMSHAMTAYLGNLKGYTYIWEAAQDEAITAIVADALRDITNALSKKHGVAKKELEEHAADLQKRFKNKLLGDPITRVGGDTKRKLSSNDRLVGALKCCLSQKISSDALPIGIAAAMLFAPETDASSCELAEFAAENGVKATLEKYSDFTDDEIVNTIEMHYNILLSNSMTETEE
ncbi:MAG: mannitol-1-phosphate 5-dehydrogenase [Ruminococcaceae bacterium]|nr:mannitol-1-phosphate 5-dehydrogenase [Oscillospiraceae bacterium]